MKAIYTIFTYISMPKNATRAFLAMSLAMIMSLLPVQAHFTSTDIDLSAKTAEAQSAQYYYPNSFCYTWNNNLQVGSSGSEVEALHTALAREGFSRGYAYNSGNNIYNEETASLVSAFQEKYRSEILSPYGYREGTGYVGQNTRNKLNSLYSCNNGGGNNNQNLDISIIPYKYSYSPDETITFTLQAKNNSPYERTLTFSSGCQTSYRIGNYDSSTNQVCTAIYGTVRIPAYGTQTWSMSHYPSSYRLSPGTYTLTGRIAGYGEASTNITISGSSSGGGSNSGSNYPLVLSPNGGESWQRGAYKLLQWQMPSVNYFAAQSVDVKFISQGYYPYANNSYYNSTCPIGQTCAVNQSGYSQTGYGYNSGYGNSYYPWPSSGQTYTILSGTYLTSYNWYVGSTPTSWYGLPSGSYQMQVCLSGTNICDTSDGYVTIY